MFKDDHFVHAPLGPLVAAARALESQLLLVWLFIIYQATISRRRTFEVTNEALAEWGVSRHAKYRALRRLEQGGLIAVERKGRRSPRVTPAPDVLKRT